MTTEKELDTVEVLKAIQKARDVKEKKTSSITKVYSISWNPDPGGGDAL